LQYEQHYSDVALLGHLWRGRDADGGEAHIRVCSSCFQRWQRVLAAFGAVADHNSALLTNRDLTERYSTILRLRAEERGAEQLLRGYEGERLYLAVPMIAASPRMWTEALFAAHADLARPLLR
jgi:hypothetical protein